MCSSTVQGQQSNEAGGEDTLRLWLSSTRSHFRTANCSRRPSWQGFSLVGSTESRMGNRFTAGPGLTHEDGGEVVPLLLLSYQ